MSSQKTSEEKNNNRNSPNGKNINNTVKVIRKRINNGPRTLKACEKCRAKKIKCIPSVNMAHDVRCMYCQKLDIKCSLQKLLEDTLSKSSSSSSSNGNIIANTATTKSTTVIKDNAQIMGTSNELARNLYSAHYYNGLGNESLTNINENVLKCVELLQSLKQHTLWASASYPSITSSSSPSSSSLSAPSAKAIDFGKSVDLINSLDSRSNSNIDVPASVLDKNFSALFSPFITFSRLVHKLNVPLQIRNLHDESPLDEATNNNDDEMTNDVIGLNILTFPEVIMLVREFKDNYGTWVSFPESIPVEDLVQMIRKSNCSVLLTTSCVLALRYTIYYHDLKTRIYKNLLYKLKLDLEKELVAVNFSIELIQSLVILSIYSSSFSSDIQIFDAWNLSAFGIQCYISGNILQTFQDYNNSPSNSFSIYSINNCHQDNKLNSKNGSRNSTMTYSNDMFERLRTYRLWNHLCLVHLTHSVLSGRMCILNDESIKLCNRTLNLSNATNFDGRMIAEISLYSILYKCMTNLSTIESLDKFIECIDKWYNRWKYLTSQPTSQFIDFNFHFSQVLSRIIWYHQKVFPNLESGQDTDSNKKVNNNSNSVTSNGNSKLGKQEKIYNNGDDHFVVERTFVGDYMNEHLPLDHVFSKIPLEDQKAIASNCDIALDLFLNVEFHKFRYLSDQLIFISVYLSLVGLKTLKYLKNNHPKELTDESVRKLITSVKKLSLRLRKIRETELKSFWVEEIDLRIPSVVLQYHSAIESYLKESFPNHVEPTLPL
ncbi:uncharacterized protein SCODWIG_02653 [Saccharomycodes ludwigii]|uniref:Zn(2)-C6 fungal-type domain-containing protein n=1 Tax=Saccharomycodes ludwigii TaxID=36035 RepID=A0A376B8A4_9ASCO|nr:uncharacterized protein SCODWIG_02653 [Saccharomycodes ludwigii]